MRWKLAREDHAIERVSISFQFKEPIPSKLWQSLLGTASQALPHKGFLVSKRDVMPQLVISAGAHPGKGRVAIENDPTAEITAWTFQAVTGAEVREELSLRRSQFIYATSLYDRWSTFKARLATLLWSSLDQALSIVELDNIKLEYWDRFNFLDAPSAANYSELLRADSKYISGFCLNETDLWHNHIGFFSPPGPSKRRLVNLNIDVLDLIVDTRPANADADEVVQRSVGIYSMAQDTLGGDQSSAGAVGLEPTLDDMHASLNKLLADVITSAMADRISLVRQASV